MEDIEQLIKNNALWAEQINHSDPNYFARLAKQQSPKFFWIGCSDSRVPANQITGLPPGEVFVHRNVANIVQEADFNVLAVLQYAVDVLKVTNIIVCGHYGCGGVKAALDNYRHGIIDNWLAPIRSLTRGHKEELAGLEKNAKLDRLCELNVLSQARHVARTTIVEDAWDRGQTLNIHSWIYRLDRGIIKQLRPAIQGPNDIEI